MTEGVWVRFPGGVVNTIPKDASMPDGCRLATREETNSFYREMTGRDENIFDEPVYYRVGE